jgi:hypothetical protein
MLKHLGFILSLVEIEYFQIDKFLFPLQVIGLNMFVWDIWDIIILFRNGY